MKIVVTSVLVSDQEKALQFYTDKLGFIVKVDQPAGGGFRWIGLAGPDEPDGVQLLLEPIGYEFAAKWQKELYDHNIPCTFFGVTDIDAEYKRLKDLGVVFRGEPKREGPYSYAMFEDTCGNLLQIVQMMQ